MRSMHEQKIEVRPARRSDVENMNAVKHAAIFGVGAESYPADQLSSWAGHLDAGHVHELEARVAGGSLSFLVATHQDVVMGYGCLDLGSGELEELYVRPDRGREGIGGRLVEALLEVARDAGIERLNVDVPANVTGFFEKHGFEVRGPSSRTLACGTVLETIRLERGVREG